MSGRPAVHAALAIAACALVAALITLAWAAPAQLALPNPPHPTLHGTAAEAADILTANLAVLAVPFMFAGATAGRRGPWRVAGDLAAVAIVAANSGLVGAALALHGSALLPYLVHLPAEAAALTLAAATWLARRSSPGPLAKPFMAVVALAVIAALAETYATPQLP